MKKEHFLGLSEEGFHHVSYMEWGEKRDPNIPIICVHGLTRNGRDFDRLAAFLAKKNYHLYCPDIVGRGDSDWLENSLHYTYEQYLADMNALIARTGAEQVDWIGTSMGGLLGMLFASLTHTPIRRLILNDVGPLIPTEGVARLSKYAGYDPDFSSMDEANHYFRTIYQDFGNLSDEDWQHLTEHSVREVRPDRFVSKVDHGVKVIPAKSSLAWQALMHPIKALEGTLFDIDLWPVWYKVKCPVLVIHGQHSDILLPHVIKRMQSSHPGIDVIEVPDTGHAPALLDADIHQKIFAWLKKTEG